MADDEITFLCDAMLGGLARWLRACGYDTEFHYGIDDRELLRRAKDGGRMLLSSDGPMFQRNVIRHGAIRGLFVPPQLSKLEQLRFVFRRLGLTLREARCMACGGDLQEVPKHSVTGEAPPLTYRHCQQFWRCQRCGRLLWHGTHWQRVARALADLESQRASDTDTPPAPPAEPK